MTSNVVSTQLTSVNQLHEVARLLMQPPTSRRVSKVPAVHALKKILLTEQQLTDEFGVDLFSLLSVPVVSVSLTVLDLSFNELGDKFWLHWMPELKEAVWPALAILNLANNQFTYRGLEAIAGLVSCSPSLTQLDLSLNLFRDTNAPPEWLQPLIRVLNGKDRKHLEVLDMSCTDFTDQDIMQLLQAQFSKFLAKLYLRSNSLTNETAKTLANHLPQMKLEVLSLAGNMIGDSGAASLAFVMDQVLALQTLDLEENQIGQDGMASFFYALNGMIESFPLRFLHLGGNLFASESVLAQIHTKLHEKIIETQLSIGPATPTVLNFCGSKVKRDVLLECCLTDQFVHVVMQTLRASPNWLLLEVLDLSGNEIGDIGTFEVGLFLTLQPPLRLLNLSNNLITDKAIEGLAEGLEPNVKLQDLLLDYNQITDAGAKQLYLKAFKANQQRRIKLSVGNPLTSECKVMLAAISQAHDLRKRFAKEFADQEKLDLSGRALRQYGAIAIIEELSTTPSSKCRALDLSRNGLGDEGAQAVAHLLRTYPRLEELDLSFNDIGNDGAVALGNALIQNCTLVSFSLHSVLEGSQAKPKLQQRGLCYLAKAIQGHKALKKLDLRNNSTSSTVLRAYVEMLSRNEGIQKFNGTSSAVFLSRYNL